MSPDAPAPVVLVAGVDPEAMAATVVGLTFDLPGAVAVRHDIDPEAATLTRTVSDLSGLLEQVVVPLEHACVSCALREDVVPTLLRLAGDGRWGTVLAQLPVGAAARQVCEALDGRPGGVGVGAVVAAVDAAGAVDDLLGDDLLRERSLHSAPDDARGVGEVGCSLVEQADAVVLVGAVDVVAHDLVATLARPDALVVEGSERLEGRELLRGGRHDHARTRAWVAPERSQALPDLVSDRVWRVDLSSDRAFHPGRLLAGLSALGGGRHRSRGCFWLPTRPGRVLEWDGAGGQLSVGDAGTWAAPALTRLVLVGTGTAPAHLGEAFEQLLLTPAEEALSWPRGDDGFEPWLGPVRDAA